MAPSFQDCVESILSRDQSTRVLLTQEFTEGDLLLPTNGSLNPNIVIPHASNAVSVVKFFTRTTGEPAPERPSLTAGTDVGVEIWFPNGTKWNGRIYVQIQGGFMGDFRITSTAHAAGSVCSEHTTPEIASELGYVVASTDDGHVADTVEDMEYLLNSDGSYNLEGFKNVAWQACHLTITKTKQLTEAYYGRPAKASYLFGCSTGGRQAYHSAQMFPNDFNGILVSCPSITQSSLFLSLGHPHIIAHNDMKGDTLSDTQLEVVSQKAQEAGDTAITGSHDGYITAWDKNNYDPLLDPSILSVEAGGNCTAPWAFSKAQCEAVNKIWYGPTLDGAIPTPAEDNGAGWNRPKHQLWWGKIRGTRIEFANMKRDIVGNMAAVAFKDTKFAPPVWNHALGKGENAWTSWTHAEFAEAMQKLRKLDEDFFHMDADNPDLREFQKTGNKILTYHGLADQGVAPQSAVAYFRASSDFTGGIEETKKFHRLFLIPGMGHCMRSRGSVGRAMIPIPTVELMLESLVRWVEEDEALEKIDAVSYDNQVSRPIFAYPRLPKYDGKGDVKSAESFS